MKLKHAVSKNSQQKMTTYSWGGHYERNNEQRERMPSKFESALRILNNKKIYASICYMTFVGKTIPQSALSAVNIFFPLQSIQCNDTAFKPT